MENVLVVHIRRPLDLKFLKKHELTILLVIIMTAGIGLMAYPSFSNWWNQRHQGRVIDGYVEAVSNLSNADYTEMLAAAQAFNNKLLTLPNRFELSDILKLEYKSCLDIDGSGTMGYIEIPKIKVKLPIYHDVNADVLQVAVGHIPGSSLPIGGVGTHTVISGHTGLPKATLFTDIDKLVIGDTFKLHILNKTLEYSVDQIKVVLPDNTEYLGIDSNKDYCTLITCTPYGVNSHRLLVRGHRIGDGAIVDENGNVINNGLTQFQPDIDSSGPFGLETDTFIIMTCIGLLIIIVLIIVVIRVTTSDNKPKKDKKSRRKGDNT